MKIFVENFLIQMEDLPFFTGLRHLQEAPFTFRYFSGLSASGRRENKYGWGSGVGEMKKIGPGNPQGRQKPSGKKRAKTSFLLKNL
jgi:hypothetical protein